MAMMTDPEATSKALGYRRNSMPPFNDLNLTMAEREAIALGDLAPTYDAVMKFRRMRDASDINATDINSSTMEKALTGPQQIAKQRERGLGHTEKLLKAAEEMQKMRGAIKNRGVVHGILGW
jgi:hypothetical protein